MSSNIELPELHNWVGLQKVSKQLLPKVEYFMYFIITIVHTERAEREELVNVIPQFQTIHTHQNTHLFRLIFLPSSGAVNYLTFKFS